MPFGLGNSSQTFQGLNGLDFLFHYVDDAVIFSSDEDVHLKHLKIVFAGIEKFGLNIKLSKCIFGTNNENFLVHNISERGIHSSKEISEIRMLEKPTTVKSLQKFIGMINYCHKYIPNLTTFTSSIYDILNEANKKKEKNL